MVSENFSVVMKGSQKDTVSNNPNGFASMDIKVGSKTACKESRLLRLTMDGEFPEIHNQLQSQGKMSQKIILYTYLGNITLWLQTLDRI